MRAAEPAEFEWVFRSAYAPVLRTVFLIMHDQGSAEEVTQDAFLRLCERWGGVVRVDFPEAWVRKVAIRAAIRQCRREKKIVVMSDADLPTTVDRLPDVDLVRAVASLPARQRAVVALYYIEDRPVDDIALLLDVSTSTVKQHLHRARLRLAELLSEQQEDVNDDVGGHRRLGARLASPTAQPQPDLEHALAAVRARLRRRRTARRWGRGVLAATCAIAVVLFLNGDPTGLLDERMSST